MAWWCERTAQTAIGYEDDDRWAPMQNEVGQPALPAIQRLALWFQLGLVLNPSSARIGVGL